MSRPTALLRIWLSARASDTPAAPVIPRSKALTPGYGARCTRVFPVNWAAMLGFLVTCDPSSRIAAAVGSRSNLTYRNLETRRFLFRIVATDVLSRGASCCQKAPPRRPSSASAAIPAVFPPVRFKEVYLVDGAVSSNTAVKVAWTSSGGCHYTTTGYACALLKPPAGAVASACMRSAPTDRPANAERIEGTRWRQHQILVLRRSHDFSQTGALIDRAIKSTIPWITNGAFETECPRAVEHPTAHGQPEITSDLTRRHTTAILPCASPVAGYQIVETAIV